ncbi:MAG: NAD-dependent epimerase/dehydratase family protein [Devosia sp.]|nr:NAD-dependent epimerase/dehydratase family protein [Devosia sp.]
MKFFVTGTAGFIGFHLARRLAASGHHVVGYDGITDYYDRALKRARLAILESGGRFTRIDGLLEDSPRLHDAIGAQRPDVVVHLAAQAGVRYSIENPGSYISANLVGTFNLLEAMRAFRPSHLLVASTSSVYGGNPKTPFSETDRTDFPVSLYAATKKSAEAISHSYAHLFGIPTTVMRFFTVYGPWGRPDMALYRFATAIRDGTPINAYSQGTMTRDFTFIDDLIEAVVRLVDVVPEAGRPVPDAGAVDSLSPVAPWRAVNIGSGRPIALLEFIRVIENAFGAAAPHINLPAQAGDVAHTVADPTLLHALTGYVPHTELAAGVAAFRDWFADYAPKP